MQKSSMSRSRPSTLIRKPSRATRCAGSSPSRRRRRQRTPPRPRWRATRWRQRIFASRSSPSASTRWRPMAAPQSRAQPASPTRSPAIREPNSPRRLAPTTPLPSPSISAPRVRPRSIPCSATSRRSPASRHQSNTIKRTSAMCLRSTTSSPIRSSSMSRSAHSISMRRRCRPMWRANSSPMIRRRRPMCRPRPPRCCRPTRLSPLSCTRSAL